MSFFNITIIKVAMSLVLIVAFIPKTEAQNKATDFLKDYYAIAGFGQYTNNRAGTVIKEDPTVNYDVLSNVTPQYGLRINVYQIKNWNFKTGFLIKPVTHSTGLHFTKEQTGLDRDYEYWTHSSCSPCSVLSIPLIAEYIIPINKRIKFMVGSNFYLSNYYTNTGGSQLNIRRASIYTINHDRNDRLLLTGAEISTGFYFLFKHFMLQPEFRYSKSFSTLTSGDFTTENYLTEPHSSKGTYKVSGDYWGISLSIYVKKRGKNKTRKKKAKRKKRVK